MLKVNFKKILLNFFIILIIFLSDRISKLYILKIAEMENSVDLYINSYLNFYLIWNKGIAFGLLSFNESFVYNIITIIIALITLVVLTLIIKAEGLKKYSFLLVSGGALGNLFDRIYYNAVPDFIDFHINDFHWFIFNIADIFITLGIICLVFQEIFFDNKTNV
jgi:signal peptidase II|tara:strand:+ start:389 stop:880 length:492 start_codon:yes stop_codon:yes gene_type:complete